MQWWNERRLHGACADVPPAEYEAAYYRALAEGKEVAKTQRPESPSNPGRFTRCPQSVYLYRLKDDWEAMGYRHEYVLGALLSRTLAYYLFKRFGEVDPARAHVKVTHERLKDLPIPRVDFGDARQQTLHDEIVTSVGRLLDGTAPLGDVDDVAVEAKLRELWGLSADEGAYVNGEFFQIPDSQAIRDLFPGGRPAPFTAPASAVALLTPIATGAGEDEDDNELVETDETD